MNQHCAAPQHRVQFSVGNPDCRSSVWTIKAKKSDVYIFSPRFGGSVKVSLHEEPTAWRFAQTRESSNGLTRRTRQWTRPAEFAPGVTQAFPIVVPASEVRASSLPMTPAEAEKVVWVPMPTTGNAVQITVLYTKPETAVSGWPGRQSMGTKCLGMLPLRNNETVWIASHNIELTPNLARTVAWWRRAQVSRHSTRLTDDIRAALFGHDKETGLRWFIDLSMPQHAPAVVDDQSPVSP